MLKNVFSKSRPAEPRATTSPHSPSPTPSPQGGGRPRTQPRSSTNNPNSHRTVTLLPEELAAMQAGTYIRRVDPMQAWTDRNSDLEAFVGEFMRKTSGKIEEGDTVALWTQIYTYIYGVTESYASHLNQGYRCAAEMDRMAARIKELEDENEDLKIEAAMHERVADALRRNSSNVSLD